MSEDQILVLAPKSFATSLCKSAEARGRAGVLNNDMTFDVEEGLCFTQRDRNPLRLRRYSIWTITSC